jgi:predicted acyl esterase
MAHAGYIFVEQDVRGRYMSEGTFSEMRPQLETHTTPKEIDESTDTYDTVEWLLKNRQ